MNDAFRPNDLDVYSLKKRFEGAEPFKHAIIDNFFDIRSALALHRAFPVFTKLDEMKSRTFSGRIYGPPPADKSVFQSAFGAMASREFVRDLSTITGIDELALDDTHEGAGAHVGLNGSELPIHADHNTHPRAPWLYRRLNVLVYLNPGFESTWRSNLLLYDRTGTSKVAEIEPQFNRAVIMDVHDQAFHGYHALRVPTGQSRQLLALYYYSLAPSPRQSREPHGTVLGHPDDVPLRCKIVKRAQQAALHRVRQLLPKPDWTGRENAVKIHT